MDYTYIHPLFTEDDREMAIDFLSDNMIKNANVAICGISSEDNQASIVNAQHPDKALLKRMTKQIIERLYGVNVVKMANYAQVQEIFYDKYASYIIRYLSYCGINANLIYFTPSSISPYAIKKYIINNPNKPLGHYNPRNHWKFEVKHTVEGNIMNPLNGMDIVILRLTGVKEYMPTLIKALFCRNPTPDELEYDNLDLKILPSDSVSNILDLVRVLNIVF